MAEEKRLSLKEMVRGTGNTPRTIRFYESEGLIAPAGRTGGGHRVYAAGELDKLQLITDLRTAGLSIEEIKRILRAKLERDAPREAAVEVSGLLGAHIEEMRRKLATLVRLRDELSASTALLTEVCAECKEPPSEQMCDRCAVLDRGSLPRAFKWIWSVH
jgi:MerR family copper efflux transcriptional regulator